MDGVDVALEVPALVFCLIILLCILVGRRNREAMELLYDGLGALIVLAAIGWLVWQLIH